MIRSMTDNEILYTQEDGAEIARMKEELQQTTALVTLSGALTTELSYDLGDELKALLMTGCHVRLDMQQVTRISAAIGDILLKTQHDAEHYHKRLVLCRVSEAVVKTLKSSNLYYSLDIETEEAAR